MRRIAKLVLAILLCAAAAPAPAAAQQHIAPSLDTNNTFTGTNTFPQINGVIFIDGTHYPCTSAGIISAISAAIVATISTVDARGCPNLPITAEIDVGNSSFYPITLLVPTYGSWAIGNLGGSSCGIKVFSKSSVLGDAPAGTAAFSLIPNAEATLYAALCTDPSPASGASYVHITGVSAGNPNAATMTRGMISLDHLFDSSETDRLMAYNFFGNGIVFNDFCCGTIFKNSVSNGYGNAGAIPVVIGGGTTTGGTIMAGAFYGLSAVHQGTGVSALYVNYNSGVAIINSVQVHQLMLEWMAGADLTTPYVTITGAYGVTFDGVGVNSGPSGTNYAFSIQDVGAPSNVVIRDVVQPLGTPYTVTNAITGNTVASSWLTDYEYMGAAAGECYRGYGIAGTTCTSTFSANALQSFTFLSITPVTVASLPTAGAGNVGQTRSVSDSTAISSEGQTCVGGNATPPNHANAFSNGTVWKCF
jgi:hypothetical protein